MNGRMVLRARAFSLIELLVVVAIITLLIGVLLPSLSRARKQAKAAYCMSNLHSLGIAVQLYLNNNRERLPGFGYAHGGSGSEPQGSWINQLQQDYADKLVTRCPADESEVWEQPLDAKKAEQTLRKVSFAINSYLGEQVQETSNTRDRPRRPFDSLGVIPRPAKTVHLVELTEVGAFAVSDHVHPETWWSNPKPLASDEVALERHLGRANYLFLEGRVEALKFEQTYDIDVEKSDFPRIHWRHNLYDPDVAK